MPLSRLKTKISKMFIAYKYRLLPSGEQKKTLNKWMGACRFVFNLGLEVKKTAWESAKVNVSAYDLMKQLTELKRTECKWLAECCAQCLESSLANLDKAYTKFFKGSGYPKFKKRGNGGSITFRRETKVEEKRVWLSKIGWIDFIQHRPIGEGEIRTTVVSMTPAGNYFVSILVKDEKELPSKAKISPETSVGVDVGLKTFAVLSDGQQIQNPKYLNQQLKRLKKEQRTLARRYKRGVKLADQSKGFHKQRLVVAKLHEKITNQRKDFLHKASTSIIRQFDSIFVEDLNIGGLMKNRSLSKAIGDVSWAEFYRLLEYKADWNGKNVAYINRFSPSSKTCNVCGAINNGLELSDRKWTCAVCFTDLDRDFNASQNIKNFGLKAKPSVANVG